MDFIDRVRELSDRIRRQLENIETEEATKSAFVMPFIAALGYDVFDPTEVVPEFTADVGTKKGEKVDYAILHDRKPILLFECKKAGTDLDHVQASQLYRYFTATETRFGVLTDGIVYRFFTDLEKTNCMDSKPFLEINLLDLEETLVDELKKFTKASFDVDQIAATASGLKYTREIKKILGELWKAPSEEFVRFFAAQVYEGHKTKAVLEMFTDITKRALHGFVNDRIKDRLESALAQEGDSEVVAAEANTDERVADEGGGIITTEEEIEAFYIVKSILREVTNAGRVFMRDSKSYCAIILDDNNRKTICRLHFNTPHKKLGLFDADKKETRVPLESLDDIYKHASELAATVFRYDQQEHGSEETLSS